VKVMSLRQGHSCERSQRKIVNAPDRANELAAIKVCLAYVDAQRE
jgi:hypothetical protein